MTTKPRGPEVFALEDEKRAIAIREEADFTAQPEGRTRARGASSRKLADPRLLERAGAASSRFSCSMRCGR